MLYLYEYFKNVIEHNTIRYINDSNVFILNHL